MLTEILNVFQFAEITTIESILPIFKSINNSYHIVFQLFIVFVLFAILGMKNTNERIESFKPNIKNVVIVIFFMVASIMSLSQVSTFLYVNF